MFFIGDNIFYPVYGAGYIYNVEEKEVYGSIKKYYIINFIDGMSIMVPVYSEESKKIRRAISEHECMKVLEVLGQSPDKLSSKWSERYKHYNHYIKDGDIFKLITVLRDISGLSKKKNLSKSELKIFNSVLNMVAGEISLALSVEIEDIKISIIDILKFGENFCS
jgi:CarD family transcriptional regulator